MIAQRRTARQLSPARQAELAGDFPAAEKAYEQELETRPSADTWQRLGLTRHLQSKFGAAIPAFREALRLNPALWTSRLFLGMCLYRVNNFQEAQVELERAEREVPPDDPGRDEIDYWLGRDADRSETAARRTGCNRAPARSPRVASSTPWNWLCRHMPISAAAFGTA